MKLVLDASMALAWMFERENDEEAERAEHALLAVADVDAVSVPVLWHTEVANALLISERRGIIKEAQAVDYLVKLYALPITTDEAIPALRSEVVMALAREHKLTAYDATYLDLTLRTGSVLATFDAKLADAAHCAGAAVFGDA